MRTAGLKAGLLLALVLASATKSEPQELSMAEIEARIRQVQPKREDYRFVAPPAWKAVTGGRVV